MKNRFEYISMFYGRFNFIGTINEVVVHKMAMGVGDVDIVFILF